jgi:hypothetical protein
LERPYELDIDAIRRAENEKSPQLLPPDGLYRTENEKGELVRLTIENGRIVELPECNILKFVGCSQYSSEKFIVLNVYIRKQEWYEIKI